MGKAKQVRKQTPFRKLIQKEANPAETQTLRTEMASKEAILMVKVCVLAELASIATNF